MKDAKIFISDLWYGSGIFLEKNNIIRPSGECQGTEVKMVSFVLVTLEIGYIILRLLYLEPLSRLG